MAEQDWVDVEETKDIPFLRMFPTGGQQAEFMTKTAPQATEREISERPSMIKSLMEDPTTLKRLKEHPVGTPLRTALGAYEYVSSPIYDMMLGLQQRKPMGGIGQDIMKTLAGERPTGLQDVYTASGLPVISTKPFAAPASMLLESLRGTPTAAVGELTLGPVANGIKTLGNMAKQYSLPTVTKIMKFLTNVPEPHSEFAINNPELLQRPVLKELGAKASKTMEDIIVPLEDNPNAIVDKKPMLSKLDELRIQTKAGDLTSQAAKLGDSEKKRLSRWLLELQHSKLTFSRARSLLGEMDDILTPTYKKIKEGAGTVGIDSFQNYTRYIRDAVRSTIHEGNFPEANVALKEYSKYKMAQEVEKTFSKMSVSFMRSLPLRVGLIAAFGLKSPIAALAALGITMPSSYKAILGGVDIGQKILSEPTVAMELMKQNQESRPQESEDWEDVK